MSRKATRQVERSGFALRLHLALSETTTEAFARQIGRTLRTVQRWRNGESEPTAEDFALIMRELGRDHDYFYPVENGERAA
jgi:transcriptional regulator with XRE-family HTH domain